MAFNLNATVTPKIETIDLTEDDDTVLDNNEEPSVNPLPLQSGSGQTSTNNNNTNNNNNMDINDEQVNPLLIMQTGSGSVQPDPLENENNNMRDSNGNASGKTDGLKVIDSKVVYKPKFKATCMEIIFELHFKKSTEAIDDILYNAINNILVYLNGHVNNNQMVGLSFSIPSLPDIKPFGLRLSFMSELNANLVVDLFELINQSNRSFSSNNLIKLVVLIVELPYGHGKQCVTKNLTKSDIFKYKRSLIQIITDKFDCLPRAIIIAKCLADADNNLMKDLLRDTDRFDQQVLHLCKIANVKLNTNIGHSLADIYKFHSVLTNYCIIIFGSTSDSNKFFFRSNNISINFKPLFLIHIDNEFHVLKSPKGFFNKNYMCKHCYTLYTNDHVCKFICRYCKSHPPCQFELNSDKTTCTECNVEFLSQYCFTRHKSNRYGESENVKM